ncbi:MAG: M3 family metallopeptidase [Paracoccaceae bacterium]|jgi:peptidyl-dipeptidase Dcp
MTDNPLLQEWTTPFEIPPFDKISNEHYAPAFELAFTQARAAIDVIADSDDAPSFANTIEAMERAEGLLERVSAVFDNLSNSDASDEMEALERELAPKFAAFSAETLMNTDLFARVAKLVEDADSLGLDAEQSRVLELYHRMFVRSGAALESKNAARLKEIMQRLASLGATFSQNVLADEKSWELALGPDDLGGLPDSLIASATQTAKEREKKGPVITLTRSLAIPFLQFSDRRDLREIVFKAWEARGANGGETDNIETIAETLKLRHERAVLLGFENFSSFKLDNEMAKTPAAVRELLMNVWKPAKNKAKKDAEKLAKLLHDDGVNDDLAAWDWRYYAAKAKKSEHDLDENEIKPYLQLDNMIAAAFDVAGKLFGLSFEALNVPLYHPDARAWEVKRGDEHIGVFIGDYFTRSTKRGGAWSWRFRGQSKMDDDVRPITVNVCNFAKAPEGEVTLLTFDDARTLFHEFGHALHSLMSDVKYKFISGTSVSRDFVELPSQLYEHWLSAPEVLSKHALHVETGEPMPKEMLERLEAAKNFDQGFDTVEFIASAMVDIDFHTGTPPNDPMSAQAKSLAALDMPDAISMRIASPHFNHVFAGDGYSSGYYSYMWSEVMDEDAFAAFEETGNVFDPDMAARLAEHIYTAGGSKDAAELYTAFRGSLPKVEALLKGRGLD